MSLDQTSTPIVVHLEDEIKLTDSFMLLEMFTDIFPKMNNTEIKMYPGRMEPAFVSAISLFLNVIF